MVRIRAFRAIDEPETCKKFIEGHQRVLSSIGVIKVTSSEEDWMENPYAFVLVVEDEETGEIHGGSRIHISHPDYPLPIQSAVSQLDSSIDSLVAQLNHTGVAEICGLWNSRKVAGMGIGSIYLNRASIAISSQLELQNLIALCAPYTVNPAISYGYIIEKSVGNEGTFYYPKLDLVATVMVMTTVHSLSNANEHEKSMVQLLRDNWNQTRLETEARKEVEITYNLELDHQAIKKFNLHHLANS